MTIGDVLGRLREEFPDVTISKIRFLEAEGLIEPERTPSGYRKFAEDDVERLRFILTAQRDEYLPLRVIRERLRDGRPPRTLVAAGARPAPGSELRLTRRQVIDGAAIEPELLDALEEYGLVRPVGRYYDGSALEIARVAAGLAGFGVEARHLRAVRAAADREAGLVEQVVSPLLRRRDPGAHERAEDGAQQVAALVLALHSALLSAALREALGR